MLQRITVCLWWITSTTTAMHILSAVKPMSRGSVDSRGQNPILWCKKERSVKLWRHEGHGVRQLEMRDCQIALEGSCGTGYRLRVRRCSQRKKERTADKRQVQSIILTRWAVSHALQRKEKEHYKQIHWRQFINWLNTAYYTKVHNVHILAPSIL